MKDDEITVVIETSDGKEWMRFQMSRAVVDAMKAKAKAMEMTPNEYFIWQMKVALERNRQRIFEDEGKEAELSNELYLGDGVYAEIENGMVKLTTRDDCPPPISNITNEIYLELAVVINLVDYVDLNLDGFEDGPRPVGIEHPPLREFTKEEIDTLFNEGKGLGFDFGAEVTEIEHPEEIKSLEDVKRLRSKEDKIRADEREKSCRDICGMCERNLPVERDPKRFLGAWFHVDGGVFSCDAAAIRERAWQEKVAWMKEKK